MLQKIEKIYVGQNIYKYFFYKNLNLNHDEHKNNNIMLEYFDLLICVSTSKMLKF